MLQGWAKVQSMEELVKLIQQRVGLTEEQARSAAQVAIEFLKSRLPAGFDKHVDSLLAGEGIPKAFGMISGLLGRK